MKTDERSNKNVRDDCYSCNNTMLSALRHCGAQYWTYNPTTDEGISGICAMRELGQLQKFANFPQALVDMGLIHKNSVSQWLNMHQRIKEGEQNVVAEVRVIEDGTPVWKRVQYHMEQDENGNAAQMLGVAENISAYKNLSENYAQAAKQSQISLWLFDFDTKMIYDFDNATNIRAFDGVTSFANVPECFIQEGSPLHPDDVPALLEMFDKLYAGEKAVKSIGRWGNGDDNVWWWYEISYTVIADEGGEPIKAIGTAIDISERVRLEERYNEEVKRRKIHNQDVVGSFKLNLTQNICVDGQSENAFIKGFTGAGTVDDFFENEYTAHVDKEDLEHYKKRFNRKSLLKSYNTGKTSLIEEAYVNYGDQRTFWVQIELDMFQNPKTGDVEAYIYAADIDQKKTAKALVDAVVNTDYDYLALIDASKDTYLLFTKSASKSPLPELHSGRYQQEVERYAHTYLVEEDIELNIRESSCEYVMKQLETSDIFATYGRVKEADGSISRKKLRFSYLDRVRKKIMLTRTDITAIYDEEQQKNEALRDALIAAQQANTAKSEFLSRMSHEIRTPMNAIIGMSALAANCVNDPVQVSDYLSKVGISARFLLSLINDILDMSRIESGKVLIRHEKIMFEEFISGINSICNAQAKEKGVEYEAIITNYTEDEYTGDAMKLQQVLVNIISNAIKFTAPGGKVQFIIHQEKTNAQEASLKFTINDTGIGISEEFQARLFIPFEQAYTGATSPYGGTGLGLAICKNLIDLMGGKISVNSIEGVGSEFVVEVKLGIPETQNRMPKLKLNGHLAHLNVLIIDDDVVICRHTQEILADMSLQADYVESGAKALETVRAQWEKGLHYDIILVDWKMPDMDGIETSREIRKIVGPEVTIIIMTAYDWIAIETQAKQAGVNMLISKPLFKSSLFSAFEQIYSKKKHTINAAVEYDFTGKRVLLVEDHILNIEVAKKLLSDKHLQVDVAENGLRAIETFAQKDTGYYDAILMDIRMPVMDGLTAAKAIRQMRKSDAATIPIIAMTANAFEEDVEKTKAAGMNAHLVKPIEPQILYQTMQRFLEREE